MPRDNRMQPEGRGALGEAVVPFTQVSITFMVLVIMYLMVTMTLSITLAVRFQTFWTLLDLIPFTIAWWKLLKISPESLERRREHEQVYRSPARRED